MAVNRLPNICNGFLKTFWPRYRGRRAGRLVQERNLLRRNLISTIQPHRDSYKASSSWKGQRSHNPSNCVRITPNPAIRRDGSLSAYVPSLYLSNVMSLAPKIDEIRHVVTYANLDCVCITESWLQSHVHDNVVALDGFNLVRRDRVDTIHGGVCTFIKDNINFTILEDLEDSLFEALWIKLRPSRLPRGYSCIVLGNIYHPPSADDSAVLQYLSKCLSFIESRYTNCGLLIVGDFNRLNMTRLKNSYDLKQIVKFPTRGKRTLDLILTNLNHFYKDPVQRPPHGLSDHMSVELQPKERCLLPSQRLTVVSRDLKPSNRLAMRMYLQEVDVPALISTVNTCAEKTSLLETIVQTGLDFVLPLRSKTIRSNDPPWINSTLKDLIRRRQCALAQGNLLMFRYLRNRVNRERKTCRGKYYESKVNHLKDCKPSLWWKEVKRLSGMSSVLGDRGDLVKSLQHIDGAASALDLANTINEAFLLPMNDFTPLPNDFQPEQEGPLSPPFAVTANSVFLKLTSLNPKKASGPDGIPAWLLKENPDLLMDPIRDILNCSYSEGRLAPSWKMADIVPIPKQKPVKEVNKHLRPISLTPILSKIAEEFVVEEHVRPAILKRIGDNQFGSIPKSSTTYALISMIHSWIKHTDGTGSTVRVVLLDYRKAFDLIDHTILAGKLVSLDIPHGIICWIIDFLKNRKQRVKIERDCRSEWRDIPAGVPQGTKLGPWMFILMIDDIDTSNTELWKYVDDTTIAEPVAKNKASIIQNDVNELVARSEGNKFQLNQEKCKELRISFAKNEPDFAPILINGKAIEVVPNVKLLGLNISSDLRWNCHVTEISKKVSVRLYFLRQLKRANIAAKELLTFYTTCIRPIMEYACPVFHNALPLYLSDELECLQKRAMRIIFPFVAYNDALIACNLDILSDRRRIITTKLFEEISNNNEHKLHKLLPKKNHCSKNLRSARKFHVPVCKTSRLKNSFIYSNCI